MLLVLTAVPREADMDQGPQEEFSRCAREFYAEIWADFFAAMAEGKEARMAAYNPLCQCQTGRTGHDDFGAPILENCPRCTPEPSSATETTRTEDRKGPSWQEADERGVLGHF